MIQNLEKYYEDMINDISRDVDDRYVEFLKEKPRTFVHENLIFDVDNLDTYYNCAGCKKKMSKAFCCAGYDLELTRRDINAIKGILPELIKYQPRLEPVINRDRFWRYGDEFEKVMIRKSNGDCAFLLPAGRGCLIHAWAVQNQLDPLDFKPYVCSLYPVVVVVIGEEVVITTLNEESRVILDTGEKAKACTLRKGEKKDHTLILARKILSRMFGDEIYSKLINQVAKAK